MSFVEAAKTFSDTAVGVSAGDNGGAAMSFVEAAKTFSDIAVGVSAILVVVFGVLGFRQWKRELKGRSRFELARRIALNASDFRERFHYARDPCTSPLEYAGRRKKPDEDPRATPILDEWYARAKRLEAVDNTWKILHEASWEASVLLDPDVTALFKPIEDSFRALSVSISAHFHSGLRMAKDEPLTDRAIARSEEHCDRVYGSPEDAIGINVDKAVDKLRERIRKYVR